MESLLYFILQALYCALFTIFKKYFSKRHIISSGRQRKNSILSNLNQIFISGEPKRCDFNLLMELDDNVYRRNQRLSFIMSCNLILSTLVVGLLGDVCGSVY